MPAPKEISVRVLKYDGNENRRWSAQLASDDGDLIVLDAQFDVDVEHDLMGTIRRGTRLIEYYWIDRWYNVFRFLNDEGETQLFYCNVNMPPHFENGILTYVDLDIDLLVKPDRTYQILDLDDFETNSKQFGYPEDVKLKAQEATEDLISLIENVRFPFDL